MADRLLRAQVTHFHDSGILDDAVVNTFYFDGDSALGVQPESDYYDAVQGLLNDFYIDIAPTVFANSMAGSARLRIYDMRDPEPRVVKHEATFGYVPDDQPPLPSEVALVMSFSATLASGDVAARRRGRTYLGHISSAAAAVINGQSRPLLAVRQAIAAAATDLAAGRLLNIGDPERVRWAVYSPTTQAGGATVDDSFFDVTHGWIDDAWDTQRRRGADATARETWAA